jgi:hypothetical protein
MVIGVAIIFAGSERNCFQKHLWGYQRLLPSSDALLLILQFHSINNDTLLESSPHWTFLKLGVKMVKL